MKETRQQKIKRYMKLSKKDLVFLVLGSQDAFDELLSAMKSKKAITIIRPK